MEVNWFFLVAALALLWIPAERLLPARARLRTFRQLVDLRFQKHRRPWWWLAVHLVDPLRAAGGMWLLMHAWQASPEAAGWVRHLPLAAMLGAGLAGLWLQMWTKREAAVALAPILYLAGLMAGALAWPVNVLVLVLAMATMVAFRHWAAFFVQAAVAVVVMGVMMRVPKTVLAVLVVLAGWPLLHGLVFQRRLVIPTRH